jgi:hypothetical protein
MRAFARRSSIHFQSDLKMKLRTGLKNQFNKIKVFSVFDVCLVRCKHQTLL